MNNLGEMNSLGPNLKKLVDSKVLSNDSADELSSEARQKIENDLKPAEIEAMINVYKVMGSTQPYTPDSDGGCL
jgi:hypothetical protein